MLFQRRLLAIALVFALLALKASASDAAAKKDCEGRHDVQPPKVDTSGLSPFRQEILRVAAGELGKVSDELDPAVAPKLRRVGWERLLAYWQENTGEDLEERPGEKHITLEKRNGLINPRYYAQTAWCGIFAFWAWKTAAREVLDSRSRRAAAEEPNRSVSGDSAVCREVAETDAASAACEPGLNAILAARWKSGIGMANQVPYVPLLKKFSARANQLRSLKPGDVMAFDNGKQHVSIVEAVVGDDLYTIDANQACGMTVRRKRKLSETALQGYFRAD